MKRLTTPWMDGTFDTFDPIDIYDNEYSKINFQNVLKKLAEYEDAEEQGLLLRLPCKVGDTVYSVEYDKIKEYKLTNFSIDKNGVWGYEEFVLIGLFGDYVFATKEETEKKLEDMKGE